YGSQAPTIANTNWTRSRVAGCSLFVSTTGSGSGTRPRQDVATAAHVVQRSRPRLQQFRASYSPGRSIATYAHTRLRAEKFCGTMIRIASLRLSTAFPHTVEPSMSKDR